MRVVLDTNVVLYLFDDKLADPLPDEPILISIITEIELLSFKAISKEEAERIHEFLANVEIVDVDSALKDNVIALRKNGLKLPDAMIAATALSRNARLLTHDVQLLKLRELNASAPPLK